MINIEEYIGSFEEASYDDANDVSLIKDSRKGVYILDEITKELEKVLQMDRPSSCDSLVINGEKIYLIEFKNRDYKNITSRDKREIRKKAYQSRELLLGLFFKDKSVQYISEHVQLLVVFKSMENSSESFGNIAKTFNKYANGSKPEIKCKLAKFESTFYEQVRTLSKREFEETYIPMIFS